MKRNFQCRSQNRGKLKANVLIHQMSYAQKQNVKPPRLDSFNRRASSNPRVSEPGCLLSASIRSSKAGKSIDENRKKKLCNLSWDRIISSILSIRRISEKKSLFGCVAKTQKEIEELSGKNPLILVCDISDEADAHRIAVEIGKTYGRFVPKRRRGRIRIRSVD